MLAYAANKIVAPSIVMTDQCDVGLSGSINCDRLFNLM